MERSESAGMNPNTGSEQANFGGSVEPESGGITGRVKSVASTVKDKASSLPAIIADGLESGAKALRQNRTAGESASSGSVAIVNDSSIAAVTDTLASGMQSSADWLREADIEKLKSGVEKQVKEHPARSILIALGAGYLIGKAFRR